MCDRAEDLPGRLGPAEHVRLRAADDLNRVPEAGGSRLVGDVAELATEPTMLDLVEALAGELEVVPLHVDRPAFVAGDVDPVLPPDGRPRTRCCSAVVAPSEENLHSLTW